MSAPTTIPVLAGTYRLDPVHSSAGFAVKHMVVSTFRARFEDFDATLTADDSGLRLEGTVDAGSIQVKDENLKAHLDSPEFFDVENHAQLRFASSDLRIDGENVTLNGELTVKGITRPVTATGTISGPHVNLGGLEGVGLTLETLVDRTAYELNWNAPLPKGGFALANDVKLIVELELVKQEA
jgi:polyisoprenoid-binding protein YceI